ncbi:hypothetical protein KOR34_43450 [Posidoniimonas corsicana]|uniref:Peptidase M48 domain-containing protein n=1 Tax=Posidoniimonas corsicana TaxID=1938618 RepID=A0A5C5UZQ5_9BACT|nr:M48 family metallopeptidase [Posidoniimonas corsicana]TWT30972.1 hypothetical protein KOR34_43450 [Posidoniimonas corsicana]
MATDFFQRQDAARRSTAWLVVLFLLGVVGIVATVVVVAAFASQYFERSPYGALGSYQFDWRYPIAAGLITLLIITGGTLFKIIMLRNGGGQSVAERLGGRRLLHDGAGYDEQKLLNVVEEMALASGVPTPPVYLLNEQGINAFAAGYSPSDAVIGVTRGAVENLSRDQLQGVIAHEFSHILNGDMRMGIRLIGILHGILLLGLVGRWLFEILIRGGASSSGYNRRHSSDKGGAGGGSILVFLGVAIVLIILGAIGSFVGGLIKAAVSRQREYLADASAVQFTRNPGGIGGALKRIGGLASGSQLRNPNAAEASHMFFAQGVWEGFTGLMATHPPLGKRILAIDPQWDGKFPRVEAAPQSHVTAEGAAGFAGGGGPDAGQLEVPVETVDHAVDQIGEPTQLHRDYARDLLQEIPPAVLSSVREPYGARAVVYGLLLDDDPSVREAQFAALSELAEADVVRLTRELAPVLDATTVNARLPLVDLALPSLRALSQPQYDRFRKSFWALVRADERLGLFEWTLAQVLMRHLAPQFEAVRSPGVQYYGLQKLGGPVSALLSAMAHAGHDARQAAGAFQAAAGHFPDLQLELLPATQSGLSSLQDALAKLATVAPRLRGQLVDACAESICFDGHVNAREAELLRGVSDLLDCPMPPLVAGQTVGAA